MIRENLDLQWSLKPAGVRRIDWWTKPEGITVNLPHDFSIGQKRDPNSLSGGSNGFFPGGVYDYEKTLFAPAGWKGKKVILEFEGVYMNAVVRFNHQIVAQHPYGYTGFHCDLTPYLLFDRENIICVNVNNNALPNTRWYSGSGIYRHVWLLTGEEVHIPPWGVFVSTPVVSPASSTVTVKTLVENSGKTAADVTVRSTLLTKYGEEVGSGEINLKIAAGSISETAKDLTVSPIELWSVDKPCLYSLKSEIIMQGAVVDTSEMNIGIRSISFDAQNGFRLNGIPMKLKGGCVHHDCGLLGAAAFDRAEERKVELLKASGFNAVRCAHNPPSPAFLDACDRLGMLVMDEAFDCWREGKSPNDYGVYFEDWWQRDMASMILRDRNHPSIILWSTGNEIIERDGRSEGYMYARKLADYARSLDNTRAVTNAVCYLPDPETSSLAGNLADVADDFDYWGELTLRFIEPLDVAGYNYLLNRYESDVSKFPGRIICGTESFPIETFDNWNTVERLPHVIGDFVWTGMDYLGEAGLGHVWYDADKDLRADYPWHQAFCGDIDICGFKRPQSYYRDCVWGRSRVPFIAVYKPENHGRNPLVSHWGWPDVVFSWTWPGFENKPVVIDIYCMDSEVELFLNGRSLGRKPVGKDNRYTASYETEYEPGELVAVGFTKGIETSRTTLNTAGKPVCIRLAPDRTALNSKFGDLSFVTVEVVDAAGNIVHNACTNIYFTVCGAGSLLAVGSGNPTTDEPYTGNQRKVHEGRAMVVVGTNGENGKIVLTAAADGIPSSTAVISAG